MQNLTTYVNLETNVPRELPVNLYPPVPIATLFDLTGLGRLVER